MLNQFCVHVFLLQVFNANTDVDTVKNILFGVTTRPVTVSARVVRIWPLSHNKDGGQGGLAALRFEILGCV